MSKTNRINVKPDTSGQGALPPAAPAAPAEGEAAPNASPAIPPGEAPNPQLAAAYEALGAHLAQQDGEGQPAPAAPVEPTAPVTPTEPVAPAAPAEGEGAPAAPAQEGLEIPVPAEGQPGGLTTEALTPFVDEYDANGELSADSYTKLQTDYNIPKDMVDAYIAGQHALAVQLQNRAYEAVGGQEQYAAMAQWAGENLSAAELEAFNASVSQADEGQRLLAIKGLNAQFAAAQKPSAPALLQGDGNSPNAAATPFASRAQMTEAMNDPRYSKDPAYRAEVEQRVGASSFL